MFNPLSGLWNENLSSIKSPQNERSSWKLLSLLRKVSSRLRMSLFITFPILGPSNKILSVVWLQLDSKEPTGTYVDKFSLENHLKRLKLNLWNAWSAVNNGAKHFIMENCLSKAAKSLKDTTIFAIEAIVRRIAMCESDVQPIEWPVE